MMSHVSYNGHGGINDRPTAQEEAAAHERHIPPVAAQTEHVNAARENPALRASANHGKPPIAATARPGEFNNRGAENAAGHANPAMHPKELPPAARAAAPNTGNAKLDQKYQQQQNKLAAQQDKERQKLQQQQDKQHQQLTKQKANDQKTQQAGAAAPATDSAISSKTHSAAATIAAEASATGHARRRSAGQAQVSSSTITNHPAARASAVWRMLSLHLFSQCS